MATKFLFFFLKTTQFTIFRTSVCVGTVRFVTVSVNQAIIAIMDEIT